MIKQFSNDAGDCGLRAADMLPGRVAGLPRAAKTSAGLL